MGASPVAVASVQAAGVGMMLHHPAMLNPGGHPVPPAGFSQPNPNGRRDDGTDKRRRRSDFWSSCSLM